MVHRYYLNPVKCPQSYIPVQFVGILSHVPSLHVIDVAAGFSGRNPSLHSTSTEFHTSCGYSSFEGRR